MKKRERMTRNRSVTEDLLADARSKLRDLWDFADEHFGRHRIRQDDHFEFFALSFLAKQRTHVDSLIALDRSQDCALIARSMLEGLCLLLWVAQDKRRAGRWRHFAFVHDWRLLRARVQSEIPVEERDRESVLRGIVEHGAQFLKPNTRIEDALALTSDPFKKKWHDEQISQIFEAVSADDIYRAQYSSFSDWHHWGVATMAARIHSSKNALTFSPASLQTAFLSTLTAFHALHDTLAVLIGEFETADSARLAELHDSFLESMQSK